MSNKAILSDRIYLKCSSEYAVEVKKKLTYRIETKIGARGGKANIVIEHIRNYKQLPRDILSLPRERLDLIPPDYEIVDKRVLIPAQFPEPASQLREDQLKVYNEVESSCFINALVGWGSPKSCPLSK